MNKKSFDKCPKWQRGLSSGILLTCLLLQNVAVNAASPKSNPGNGSGGANNATNSSGASNPNSQSPEQRLQAAISMAQAKAKIADSINDKNKVSFRATFPVGGVSAVDHVYYTDKGKLYQSRDLRVRASNGQIDILSLNNLSYTRLYNKISLVSLDRRDAFVDKCYGIAESALINKVPFIISGESGWHSIFERQLKGLNEVIAEQMKTKVTGANLAEKIAAIEGFLSSVSVRPQLKHWMGVRASNPLTRCQ